MVAFLRDVAQHGNLRLSDDEEAWVLDDLRATAAELLDAPEAWIAITGGASEALGQVAATLSSVNGSVVLVSSDFPSVTYPWLAERERLGTPLVWVNDTLDADLTDELVRAIGDRTRQCFSAVQFAQGAPCGRPRGGRVGRRLSCHRRRHSARGAGRQRAWMVGDAVVCSGYKWLSSWRRHSR
jgi:hypothetical protein